MPVEQINQAVKLLQQGNIIAYPTEAVYGLGCDPDNLEAVSKLLQLKQRPKNKGLILVAAEYAQLMPYLQPLANDIREKIFASWPGPVTWLIPVKPQVSELLCGEHSSLAVRVSAHPVVRELCLQFGKALVSTSANLAGHEPARTATEVQQQFGDKIACIVDGETNPDAKPSEIRDAITNKIIRAAN